APIAGKTSRVLHGQVGRRRGIRSHHDGAHSIPPCCRHRPYVATERGTIRPPPLLFGGVSTTPAVRFRHTNVPVDPLPATEATSHNPPMTRSGVISLSATSRRIAQAAVAAIVLLQIGHIWLGQMTGSLTDQTGVTNVI